MKILEVKGNNSLSGTVRIAGAKNSAVALIPACILSKNKTTLTNIPNISDINDLEDILEYLNVDVKRASESIVIDAGNMKNILIPNELSSKLRASYYFMASLLARFKKVQMYFPGGCQIGSRPIDQTLKVFRALGATVKEENCLFTIEAIELKGCEIELDMPSVGATVNAIIASVLAKGRTIIKNAAREPEIIDLIEMLNDMGAKITGAGTSTIAIDGVSELDGCFHTVIPDRIEAGTYLIIGTLLGNYLKIDNLIPEHIKSLTDKLIEMGADISINDDYIIINAVNNLMAADIKTQCYPGFPTDLQQPFTTLLTQVYGESEVNETIYENRFMNIPYLQDMGADIKIDGRFAKIKGPTPLKGTKVVATDLRAGASLLIAALKASGTSQITNIEHILRGYEEIVEKLTNIGAKIEIKEI